MPRNVTPNVRLFAILAMAIAGAVLNFFLGAGDGVGDNPLERVFWGGIIGGFIGQLFVSYADS